MTLNELRRLWRQAPFQPLEILMVDGRIFSVPHRDFLLVPPGRGTWIIVAHADGTTEHVNTAVISSVRPTRNGKKKQAG